MVAVSAAALVIAEGDTFSGAVAEDLRILDGAAAPAAKRFAAAVQLRAVDILPGLAVVWRRQSEGYNQCSHVPPAAS